MNTITVHVWPDGLGAWTAECSELGIVITRPDMQTLSAAIPTVIRYVTGRPPENPIPVIWHYAKGART